MQDFEMRQKYLRYCTVALLLLLASATTSAATGQTGWTPEYYDMNIRIDFIAEKIFVECTVTVRNDFDRPSREIPLLLYRLLQVSSARDSRNADLPFLQQVVTVEGRPKLQVNSVLITLPEAIAAGEHYTLQLSYEGYIFGYTEGVGAYVREKIREPFTILRQDTYAYPHIGYPTHESGFAVIHYSFDYHVSVTVPEHMVVANVGELVSRTHSNGQTTYTYASIKPSWRMDFAVASYEILERDGIRVFHFPENREGALRILETAVRTLDLYAAWFGQLRDFKNFGIIQIPQGYGSQADVTGILQTGDAFESSDNDDQLYHELSHLWHPMETEPFPPCRWNEGLATFMQYYTVQEMEGREGFIHRASDAIRRNFIHSCEQVPGCPETPLIEYGEKMMFRFSYTKGMILFHVLYELIGRETFFGLVGSYYREYHETGGATGDLTRMITDIGAPGLSRFVDEWFYGTESNVYLLGGMTVDEIVRIYRAEPGS
jgi:hypothetical protein